MQVIIALYNACIVGTSLSGLYRQVVSGLRQVSLYCMFLLSHITMQTHNTHWSS